MSIFEYDEEKHMRTVRSEGFEDGLEQGEQNSRYQIICNMLRESLTPELISRYTEQPVDYINEIQKKLHSEICERTDYNE